MKSVNLKINILRFSYILLMIIGVIFGESKLDFINSYNWVYVHMLYYSIAISVTVTFYIYEIQTKDLIIFIFYPVLMLCSPVPHGTIIILIAVLIAIISKCKNKIKAFIIPYLAVCIFLGVIGIYLNFLFGDFGKNTTLSSEYSLDRQYRVDVDDADQGALGGDTYIRLYSIYFDTFEKYNRNIYHGGCGDKPTVRWVDNENIEINGSIEINIRNSPMYENKKKK